MNKAEFIDAVADKAGLNKKDAKQAVDAALDVITETLAKGEDVVFVGFGTFATSVRAARTALVPGTSKKVELPETRVAKLKIGKLLKEAVAGTK